MFYLLNNSLKFISTSNYFQTLYEIIEGKLFKISKKKILEYPYSTENKEVLKKQTYGSMPKEHRRAPNGQK